MNVPDPYRFWLSCRLLCIMFSDLWGGEGFDVEAVDAETGAAEHGEFDQQFAVSAGEVDDLSLKASESPADDSYAVASAKRTVDDAHGAVGIAQDEAEGLHLAFRYCGGTAFGADGAVGHEPFDERICNYATTFRLAAADKHCGADHYLFAPDAAAAPEHPDVALGGYVAGVA